MSGDDTTGDLDFEQMMLDGGVRSYQDKPASSPRSRPAAPPKPRPEPSEPPPAAPPSAPSPREELKALEAQLAQRGLEVGALVTQLTSQAGELERVQNERSVLSRELRELKIRVGELEALAEPESPLSLTQLLTDRGCEGREEMAQALGGLLECRPDDLLGAVEDLSDGARSLKLLLNDRLFLLCGGVDCQVESPGFVLQVPPRRCDVCAGSPIQAAFVRFVEVAVGQQLQRVLVVGGSPAYRKTLRDLAEARGEGLELILVTGSGRRTLRQAEADLRRADLVVLWGGTILDHSVSELYRSGSTPIVRVSQRGITRMLAAVRSQLASD